LPDIITVADRIAEQVLFPASLATDASPIVPREMLDALAEAGLYGISASREVGGLAADAATEVAVIETLAAGCLTTTFVWMQHLGTAAVVAQLDGQLHDEWARPLASGARRAGVAFSHLRRPDPPMLTATEVPGGYVVNGMAPLVTGWGRIDVVHMATRLGPDIAWLLVDASASPTLEVRPLELAAVNASATVALRAAGHFVPASRLTRVQPLEDWLVRDAAGLRTNGFLSVGVASRCLALLGASRLDDQLALVRSDLLSAQPEQFPEVRARASLFALDAASSLVAAGGGRSVVRDQHAQRLAREAIFLLVQGQTPAIRAAQLALFEQRSEPDGRRTPVAGSPWRS
jgi:alkylation response protein AidB-like acyl-CoA dehydrogenase